MISKDEIVKRSKAIFKNTPGVYFLIHKGEIVYIGCSCSSCENRIKTHRKSAMVFDSYYIYEFYDISYYDTEKKCIRKYKPKYNKSQNPDYYDGLTKELLNNGDIDNYLI